MAYTKNPFLQGMRKKLKNYCPRFFFFSILCMFLKVQTLVRYKKT